MASTVLVESDIEKGKTVLKALDAAGVDVRSALWRFIPEDSDWRLILALPLVDSEGPRAAYDAVRRALAKHSVDVPVWQITVVSPSDPLVKQLRRAVATPPRAISDIRFTKNVIGNILIEDALIYRSCSEK